MPVTDPLPSLEYQCHGCDATWKQGKEQHYTVHLGPSGRPFLMDVESEPVKTWHFCTLACLGKWAKAQKVDHKIEHNKARAAAGQ